MYDMSRMRALGKEIAQHRARLKVLVPDIEEEIRNADRANVPQVEIIKESRYSRNSVRLLSMTDEEREAERAKRRKTPK